MNKKSPFIVAVSGVGGAGKNAILEVFKKYPDQFESFVSYTDRPKRDDDIPGETYHFVSEAEFSTAIKNNEFIEWEQTRGKNRYGRKKADFKRIINSGKIPVMNVDVLGVAKFKKIYKTLSFFILPPSREEAINRMKKRGTDTPEAIGQRIDRYDFEYSYKDKYDYVIINDDLKKAQDQIVEIINKEIKKREKKVLTRNIALALAVFWTLTGGFYSSYFLSQKPVSFSNQDVVVTPKKAETSQDNVESVKPAQTTEPSAAAKEKISQSPPQTKVQKKSIIEQTKKNTDGSTTTTVATSGNIGAGDLARAASNQAAVNSPYDITFRDETGQHPDLGQKIKDYINNQLKWRNEITSIKEITLRDAGDSGWSGQYLGQYSSASDSKDIIFATGSIILNSYYYTSSALFDDYMKLVLSHEYGHHYTLYHKWVDWDLPAGTRFPDSYYAVRPLSKATTATDYSLGWKNCEVEIIAEDYSYLYSGYGLDAMSSTYGFPSVATKTWLDNIGSAAEKGTVANNPPAVEISSPSTNATISGQVSFAATATDDFGISKVSFYVGDNLLIEDQTAPYETTLKTTSYPNGSYVLKVVASDGTLTAEKTINVIFQNDSIDLEKPTVSILAPSQNPVTLSKDDLNIKVTASDNVQIDKIEFYFEDTLQGSWNLSNLNLKISFANITAGTYTLKFRAYDKAGNYSDALLTIIKP